MALLVAAIHAWADSANGGLQLFERQVRPVLVEFCHECHGPQRQKGGLRLDSREALLAGGESGPAIIPGHASRSLLVEKISTADADSQMPPKSRLNPRQIAALGRWIDMGAPWPEPVRPQAAAGTSHPTGPWADKDLGHWAFQPIRRPVVPVADGTGQPGTAVDAFLRQSLAGKGLAPNPPASRRELLRRLFYDLVGLPPSFEEVAAFENDAAPDAYARWVDRLLARPEYGERWARHWLDVVRFAQTTGYERDGEKPYTWRYRDYVIRAFNDDKPYDRFVREQIAGDEIAPGSDDALTATAFFRLGVWDDEPADRDMAVYDELDDWVSVTGGAFLGLTLGCARCHDHKTDPLTQRDYYQIAAFFRNVRGYEPVRHTRDSAAFRPLGPSEAMTQWFAEQEARMKAIQDRLDPARADLNRRNAEVKKASARIRELELLASKAGPGNEAVQAELKSVRALHDAEKGAAAEVGRKVSALDAELNQLRNMPSPFDWTLAVREKGTNPEPTRVLARGNPLSPRDEVHPAFPPALGGGVPHVVPVDGPCPSTGRRRALADWMTSPTNPLTARVMVNRIWQHHFGAGIVRTPTDFGRAGAAPTHPALLDWLASEFIAGGWSVKRLHRVILLSEAYQMASRADNPLALRLDPGNQLVWRQSLRRLDAEAIRDTILSVSGKLSLQKGGRGFFPRLAGEVLAGGSRPGLDWELSSEAETSRRSVYTFIKRSMLAPALQVFDYSNTDSPLGERPTTTVAPQSLMMLNDSFLLQQASAFAERVRREVGEQPDAFVRRGYQVALGRDPGRNEREAGLAFLVRQARLVLPLAGRITFRPDVPESLYQGYLGYLGGRDCLLGPAQGWKYFRGEWSGDYEGIRTVDRQRGPFALSERAGFTNGTVSATLILHRALDFAGLLFRASAQQDVQAGYELTLDARRQRILLRRHAGKTTILAEHPAVLPAETPIQVCLKAVGPVVQAWIGTDPAPVLAVTETDPFPSSGAVGIRVWGASASVDSWIVHGEEGEMNLCRPMTEAAAAAWAGERARASLCLLLLNLNETVYVD